MKTLLSLIVITVIISLASCREMEDLFDHIRDKDKEHEGISFSTDKIFAVPFFVADENGDAPTDPATLVYENRKMNPILAPDGHQLTLGEFNAVTGTLTMMCTPRGTRIEMEMEGLIPYGTYTMWAVVFDESGAPPVVASGTDQMQGLFVASPDGEATYTALVPSGEMSDAGSIDGCLLDEPVVRIFGAYHIDGQTYGGAPGPAGTYLEQFGWVYQEM